MSSSLSEGAAAVRDLASDVAPDASQRLIETSTRLGQVAYDPSRDREALRGKIAMTLVWALVGVVVCVLAMAIFAALVCTLRGSCGVDAAGLVPFKTVLELVFSPLVGLVGAVAGFYFGEKSARGAG